MRRSQSQYTTKDFLDAAICGLPPRKRKHVLFTMLAAHIDDSGSNGQGPVFVLGGYVASVIQWKGFSEQWQMALDLPPKLKVVKIQHALRPEEGWARIRDPKQRNERIKRFASITHKYAHKGIVVSAGWNDLKRIKKEFLQRPKEKLNPPFYLLLINVLMSRLLSELLQEGYRGQVDFVCDEQGALSEITVDQFNRMRATLPKELAQFIAGPPMFRDDEQVLPLQAAHNIAWLHRRFAAEHDVADRPLADWIPEGKCLAKLKQIPTNYYHCSYDYMAAIFSLAKDKLEYPDTPI